MWWIACFQEGWENGIGFEISGDYVFEMVSIDQVFKWGSTGRTTDNNGGLLELAACWNNELIGFISIQIEL
jgi:hypothetical protein